MDVAAAVTDLGAELVEGPSLDRLQKTSLTQSSSACRLPLTLRPAVTPS